MKRSETTCNRTSYTLPLRARRLISLAFMGLLALITSPWERIVEAYAQATVQAEIAPESGSINDLFIFTVTFEGSQQQISPQVQTSADFDVQFLGPRSFTSIVNGTVLSQQSFVYQLTPKHEGTLRTPEVHATVNAMQLVARPLSVVIGAGAPPPDPSRPDDAALFMNQTATPNTVYLGQQIVNSLGIYTRVNLKGVSVESSSADGFWQETISNDRSSQKTLQGKEYTMFELTRALFPLKTGNLVIPGRQAIAKIPVVKRAKPLSAFDPFNDDFFEQFFQGTHIQETKLSSNEISVEVQPLPPVPVDMNRFSRGLAIVGNTKVSTQYADSVMNVGESKNVSVIVTSEGNLNPLQTLPLSPSPGVKLYEGQTQTTHDTRGARLVTQKTFTYTVVPVQAGAVRIPGPTLAFFDPDTRSYTLASTRDITFLVAGQPNISSQANQGGLSPSVSTPTSNLIPTLPPIQAAPSLKYREKSWWEEMQERISVQLALLILASTIAIVGLGALLITRRSIQSSRLSLVNELALITELADFERLVRTWIVSKVPDATTSSSLDELRALIRSRLSDKGAALALVSILDEIEVQRYGGKASSTLPQLKERFLKASGAL